MKDAPNVEVSDDGDDFTNTENLEVVKEQQYSTNIIPDCEIQTENEMAYEEWLAAQGLLGLNANAACQQDIET